MTDLRDLDEALAELRRRAIRTSKGSFIRLEDMEELLAIKLDNKAKQAALPQPKSFAEAKEQILKSPELVGVDVQPQTRITEFRFDPVEVPSAIEGVKS